MGTGYIRADTANNIDPNKTAQAQDIDLELDAVQAAFHATTGHTHDGTSSEGAPVTLLGPTQDVVATATVLRPAADGAMTLGSGSFRWGNTFIVGNISVTGTVDGRDISADGALLDAAVSDIDDIEDDISDLQADLAALDTGADERLDEAEADIVALEALTTTHTSQISTNSSDIDSLEADVASLETLVNAMMQTVISAQYPVGSLYFTSNSSVPALMATGRTWVAYAEGRAVVGVGTADGVAYAGGTTRGTASEALVTANLPAHTHGSGTIAVNVGNAGNDFVFSIRKAESGGDMVFDVSNLDETNGDDRARVDVNGGEINSSHRFAYDGTHDHSASVSGSTASVGSGTAHNNIQPSIGVYVFRRTA